ncbi:transposase [Thiomicrospira aerophila AL3]|uniref:Transposase n=1 Tax=Thiomicrospira aerophila AL3 TaxID=717772 RepID=W0DXH3_9GAMM|nr:TniB family NTP-binding protein [Thiomicrospira aerophila]AHF01978.1 transposase [Thiomicrospira aerophila AL3]
MTEQYSHLHESVHEVILQGKQERIDYMNNPLWINHNRSTQVIQLLNQLLRNPKKPRMRNLLMIGEPNIGKTSLIKYYSNLHPSYTSEDEDGISRANIPLIVIDAPTLESEKALFVSILEQFWTPFNPEHTPLRLRNQVISLMRECNVRMLIIDEFHNLLTFSASKRLKTIGILKTLGNELMIPIVAVGIHDAMTLINSDPQIASRFDTLTIPRWDLDKNFRGLLLAFEKRLPLRKPSRLHEKDKTVLLHNISQGNTGDLHRLLIECATYAIENEIEEISTSVIQKFSWVKPTHASYSRQLQIS